MADVDAVQQEGEKMSATSSVNLAAYKEPALVLLTFLVPPAAIAIRQGKDDLETRHLALSLALYLSVIWYLPSVVHAYWLLYVRDNGGVREWAGARLKQADGLWKEHGGVVKDKVDEYAPKVTERVDRVRAFTNKKINYVKDQKDKAITFVTEKKTAALELLDDGQNAYSDGKAIEWAKEKLRTAVEKVKSVLEPYPRLQTIFIFTEKRVLAVLDMCSKIFESILTKIKPAAAVEEEAAKTESSLEDSSADSEDSLASSNDNDDGSAVDPAASKQTAEKRSSIPKRRR